MKTVFLALTLFASTTLAQTRDADLKSIQETLFLLSKRITEQKVDGVLELFSPESLELREGVKRKFSGSGMVYLVDISPVEKNVRFLNENYADVNGIYQAQGAGWNVSGLSANFLMQKRGDKWLINKSDFMDKIGFDGVFSFLSKIMAIVLPVAILLQIFTLWMFVSCCMTPMPRDSKIAWIVLMLMTHFIGATIYYFKIRKNGAKPKPKSPRGMRPPVNNYRPTGTGGKRPNNF